MSFYCELSCIIFVKEADYEFKPMLSILIERQLQIEFPV